MNGLINFYVSLTSMPSDDSVNIHNVNYFSADWFRRNIQWMYLSHDLALCPTTIWMP